MDQKATQLVPAEEHLPDAEAPEEDQAVAAGIRTWQQMRAENKRLRAELSQTKDYVNKLEAVNSELATSNNLLRTDNEFYKLMAIEAKTHLHIIQGHVNAACNQVKNLSERK